MISGQRQIDRYNNVCKGVGTIKKKCLRIDHYLVLKIGLYSKRKCSIMPQEGGTDVSFSNNYVVEAVLKPNMNFFKYK